MQLVTVRLDRIFDVVHLVHKYNLTLFGFQYGHTRVFGVSIPGQHQLVVGEVLTACLEKDNDWTTLLGWYNHTTRATVVASAADRIIAVAMALVIAAVALRAVDRYPVPIALLLLVLGAGCYGSVRSLLFRRRVRAALARVQSAPVPKLAPPPS